MGACTACHLVLHWWSGCRDLNPGPLRPERSALPSCATARSEFPRSPIILAVTGYCLQRLGDAWRCWFEWWVELDDEFTNSPFLHRLHAKSPIIKRVRGPSVGYLARE